jgi:hypothetical protein
VEPCSSAPTSTPWPEPAEAPPPRPAPPAPPQSETHLLAGLVDRVFRGLDAHLAQLLDEVLEAEDAFVGSQKGDVERAFDEADQVAEAVYHFS